MPAWISSWSPLYHAGMETPNHYEQPFERALLYLQTHYDSDINLHHIAAAAGMSPWHWHRVYRSVMGETLHDTLTWMRLHRAAWLLCHTDKTVADIARTCGYRGNAQSFTRIFRRDYGLSPLDYRHRPLPDYPVSIQELAPIPVIMLEHGERDSQRLCNTFLHLSSLLRLRGWQDNGGMRAFSIHHPLAVSARLPQTSILNIKTAGRRYAAFALPLHQPAAPLQSGMIAGGRYAVLRHCGAYADLDAALDWFLDWFRQNGLTIAAAPVVLEYLDMQCQDQPPVQNRANICVPLA